MCANHSTIGAIAPVTGIEPALLSPLLQPTTLCYVPWAFTIDRHINPLDVFSAYPQHIYTNILIADLTGLEPAILGLTNLRYIPLKLQTNLLWGLSVTLRSLSLFRPALSLH